MGNFTSRGAKFAGFWNGGKDVFIFCHDGTYEKY